MRFLGKNSNGFFPRLDFFFGDFRKRELGFSCYFRLIALAQQPSWELVLF